MAKKVKSEIEETKTKKKENVRSPKTTVKEKKVPVKPSNSEKNIEETKTITVTENKNVTPKKNSNLKTIIGIILAVLVVFAFIYSIIESKSYMNYYNEVTVSEAQEIIKDDELSILYWASPDCPHCVRFGPIVKKVSRENKITFNYINAASLTNDEYATMLTYFGAFDESYVGGLGTPSIILVQDGKVVDISVGALQESELVNYLKTKGFIK